MKFHFWGFDSLTWVISLSWLLFWLFFPGLCHRILIVTLSFSLSFLQPLSHSVQHLSGCHSIEKRTDRVFFFFSFFFFCLSGVECQQLWWIYGLKNISLLTCLCRDFSFFFSWFTGDLNSLDHGSYKTPVFFWFFFLSIEYCPWLSVSCFSLFFSLFLPTNDGIFFLFRVFFSSALPISFGHHQKKTIVFFFSLWHSNNKYEKVKQMKWWKKKWHRKYTRLFQYTNNQWHSCRLLSL